MKADSYGTPTEQARYRMGWMTPTERKKDGQQTRCASCRFFHFDEGTDGWGGLRLKARCGHPMAAGETGQATRENALCAKWEIKA